MGKTFQGLAPKELADNRESVKQAGMWRLGRLGPKFAPDSTTEPIMDNLLVSLGELRDQNNRYQLQHIS